MLAERFVTVVHSNPTHTATANISNWPDIVVNTGLNLYGRYTYIIPLRVSCSLRYLVDGGLPLRVGIRAVCLPE